MGLCQGRKFLFVCLFLNLVIYPNGLLIVEMEE